MEGPKHIFLFIGDGMGPNHIIAAQMYAESEAGKTAGISPLRFADFPVSGAVTTHNYFGLVTDSAAAATAMASGKKTANGLINMNPLKTRSFTTISAFQKAAGRRVGVVSSSPLNSATPAAFYASAPSRDDDYDIAVQLAESPYDYFGGGGLDHPKGDNEAQPDAYDIATAKGFTVVKENVDFSALSAGVGRTLAVCPSSLPDFTRKGIELLSSGEGFFMVVESGKIDTASHANKLALMIPEVIALDESVAAAVDFYNENPDDTLIVVTSDHETGGLTIADGEGFDYGRFSWTTTGHTGQAVRVFALGVGQELFSGSYDNTGIFDRLKALTDASAH